MSGHRRADRLLNRCNLAVQKSFREPAIRWRAMWDGEKMTR